MARFQDLTGQKFDSLTVIRRISNNNRSGHTVYECLCDCGKTTTTRSTRLRRDKSKSCGHCRRRRTGCHDISGHLWDKIKRNSSGRQRGKVLLSLPFELTVKQAWELFLRQGRKCALTGMPIHFGVSCRGRGKTASLDRIDSNKGYTLDNVQWVHKTINLMKQTLDVDTFVDFCERVADHARSIGL